MEDFLKIGLVLASSPLWLPFAKALFEEFVAAMRQDGGFVGSSPNKSERKEIQAQIDRSEPPRVVIEPLAHILQRQGLQAGDFGEGEESGTAGGASPAGSTAGPKRFRT